MTHRKQLIEEILKSFHAIRCKIKAKSKRSKDQMPVTPSQWFVLDNIESCQNLGVKDISKILGMSSSAVTQLVDGLVKNDYVIRQEDPEDRRMVQLRLSPTGKKQIAEMKEKRIQIMAELFDVLSESELKTYLQLHKKIVARKNIFHDSTDG